MQTRKSKWTSLTVLAGMVGILLACGTPSAYADSVVLNLNQSAAFGPGNYGTVTMTLNGLNQIVIAIAITNGTIIDTGSHQALAFNESTAGNPALTVSGISNAAFSFTNAPSGAAQSFPESGVGTFEFAFDGPAPNAGIPSLTFTVSRTGGFTSVFNLIEAALPPPSPATGAVFSVDILRGAPCTGACTGLVYATTPVPTPEPTSILLLGSALISLGAARRRLLRK